MRTECIDKTFVFQPLDRRDVVGRFDGGTITSDAGALLLREVIRASSVIERFADCFTDFRSPERIEHEPAELLAQRVFVEHARREGAMRGSGSLLRAVVMAGLGAFTIPGGRSSLRSSRRG